MVRKLSPASAPCCNCRARIPLTIYAVLFCSDTCREEAKFVRYVRRCKADGRIQKPDVLGAIEIRRAIILGGGYPSRERAVPESVRKAVVLRAAGRCERCGGRGSDIHHRRGNSNLVRDLELLCRKCHNRETQEGIVEVDPASPEYPILLKRWQSLERRIEAKIPTRPCDDQKKWLLTYPRMLRARQEIVRRLGSQRPKTGHGLTLSQNHQ